jgi:starch synthase (maltosyl-transferring)
LQQLRNLTVHSSEDDAVLCYSKRSVGKAAGQGSQQATDDTVIVVVNVDPHGTRETVVHLDMPSLGYDWHDTFVAEDLITGEQWRWGETNYVRLDPSYEPAHVLAIRKA